MGISCKQYFKIIVLIVSLAIFLPGIGYAQNAKQDTKPDIKPDIGSGNHQDVREDDMQDATRLVKKEIKSLTRKAATGDPQAQTNLGVAYFKGMGVVKDYVAAKLWFEEAAKKDFPSAELYLGYIFHDGLGTRLDYAKALFWFEKAASHDIAEAQFQAGIMYNTGKGAKRDWHKSSQYLKAACQNGLAKSCVYMANLLAGNKEEEIRYYQKACELDYRTACAVLKLKQNKVAQARQILIEECNHHDQNACNILIKLSSSSQVKSHRFTITYETKVILLIILFTMLAISSFLFYRELVKQRRAKKAEDLRRRLRA